MNLIAGHNPVNGNARILDGNSENAVLAEAGPGQHFAVLYTVSEGPMKGMLIAQHQLSDRNPYHFMPAYIVANDYWDGTVPPFPTHVVLKIEVME